MAPGFKDMRVNGNNDWGSMGHAPKSDTEILCLVPWLMVKKGC